MTQLDTELFEKVGERLHAARSKLGLSQAAMATTIGVSARAYHAYEKGKRGIPIEALVSMHVQFGIEPNEVLLGVRAPVADTSVDALESFERKLDLYIAENEIALEVTKRSALAARWYRSYLNGKEIPIEDVKTWIEILVE